MKGLGRNLPFMRRGFFLDTHSLPEHGFESWPTFEESALIPPQTQATCLQVDHGISVSPSGLVKSKDEKCNSTFLNTYWLPVWVGSVRFGPLGASVDMLIGYWHHSETPPTYY